MNKVALAFGIGSALLLAAGPAGADCLAEVQSLEKQIVSAHKKAAPGFGSEVTTGRSSAVGTPTTPGADVDSAAPASDPVLDPAPGSDADVTAESSEEAIEPVPDPAPGTELATEIPAEAPDSTTGPIEPGAEVDTAPALVTLEQAEDLAAGGDEAGCIQKLEQAKQELGMAE